MGITYIAGVCTDDDSRTRADLCASYKQLLLLKSRKKIGKLAKIKSSSYVEDHHKLPLYVQVIDNFLTNPAHRCMSLYMTNIGWPTEEGNS